MTDQKKYTVWNQETQSYEEVSFVPPYVPVNKKPPPKPKKLPREYKKHQDWMRMLAKGFTQKQVAAMFGVTRSAINMAIRRSKEYSVPKELVELNRTQKEDVPPPAEEVKPKFRLVKRMRETLKIRDKFQQIVWFVANKFQRRLDALVVMCESLKTAFIIIILKSRQLGFSTRIEGYAYTWCKELPNTEALLAANAKDNTKKVFRITKRFFVNDPEAATTGAKFNREALEYPEGHGSRIDIVTAETEDSGASGTTNVAHFSEYGLFNRPADFWSTFFPAWPGTAGSRLFVESTGRHDAVDFKTLWESAFLVDWKHPIKTYQYVKGCVERGTVPQLAIFECWLDDDTAEIPLAKGETLNTIGIEDGDCRGLDDKELKLVEEFPVLSERPEKMKWFHEKYIGLKRNWARVMTEFPLRPEHPFMFFGGPAYSQNVLKRLLEEAKVKQGVWRGEIEFDKEYATGKPRLVESPFGHLLIFESPLVGYLYVLGLDCAQGTGSGDYNEIVVIRVPKPGEKRKVVAHWRTNEREVGPGMAAVNAWLIAKHYGCHGNIPLIIPERQAINVAAIEKLLEGHSLFPLMTAPYPMLFSYKQKDRDTGQEREEYGFQTTQNAKESSIDALATEIAADNYEIESEILIQQLIGFAEDPLKKGKGRWVQRFLDPETGKPHDDGESAMRMANYGVNWMLENDIPVLERVG